VGTLEKETTLTDQHVDRLDMSMRQLMLIDERVKALQAQAAAIQDRVEAISRNLSGQQQQLYDEMKSRDKKR
jgi:hypothetical protein